jgi:hypothetical protein
MKEVTTMAAKMTRMSTMDTNGIYVLWTAGRVRTVPDMTRR